MAIAFDTSVSYESPITSGVGVPYTVGAVANSILLIYPTSVNTDANNVSSVTYNGVSATQVGTKQLNGTGYNAMYAWGVLIPNPDGNTHDIVVNFTGTDEYLAVASYSGVKQEQPEAVGQNSTANSSTWSVSVTTATDNAWVTGAYRHQSVGTGTAGADTTFVGSDNAVEIIEYTSNPKASPGSVTLNVTGMSTNPAWGTLGFAISLAPVVAVTTGMGFFRLIKR